MKNLPGFEAFPDKASGQRDSGEGRVREVRNPNSRPPVHPDICCRRLSAMEIATSPTQSLVIHTVIVAYGSSNPVLHSGQKK